ncbi:auxin-responsive protein SAUR28-like [Lotus japonicus]|uniref:auxin-responsive protein SAUR28-like n=1 Tax=Lotus japonicus TaxID=34305 RepID=UPI00258B0D65|nr:auxin-responsive protein SAUR28-like [Lotus japonicus]
MGAKGSKLSSGTGGSAHKRIEGTLLAPKGFVPIFVGTNEDTCTQFFVHIKALRDAFFCELLGRTAEEYGFMNEGVLRIPFEAHAFEEWFITNSNKKLKMKIRRF